MKKTVLFISMLLAMTGSALADNTLRGSDLSLLPTEEKELAIELANDDEFTAFQFDLTLPAGVTLITDKESKPDISKGSRLDATHSVDAKKVPSGAWRFIGYSSKKAAISGKSGVLVTLKVKAAADAKPADLKATLSGIVFTKKDKTDVKLSSSDVKVTIEPIAVITIDNLSREYGNANPELTYKQTGRLLKGEPVLTTTATKGSGVGSYDIVLDAESVEGPYTVTKGTFTVTKAPLTIKAGKYTRKQGEANPEFTLEYEGFKNGETADVLTKNPVTACEATEASATGKYTVKVSGAEAKNYEITYVDGTLNVTDADAVIVKANSYSRVYGEANPDFGFTTSGAALVGTPVITCDATVNSPVGTYDIVVSKGSVSNYNVTYEKGTLTITPAPLTIKAGTYTKKQGEDNPEFTLTYDGFKNEDNEAVLTAKPTATTTATKESAPGDYAVNVSGAVAGNYEISYVPGKLTVTAADPVTVTAKSYTRFYGEANPSFGYDSEGADLVGIPEITCAADAKTPVGTYEIVVSKGSVSNYNTTFVKGTLTIKKAPLTIKAGTYARKQGEDNPVFPLEYEGFKNGETASVLTKKPETTCEATKDSPKGDYVVTVSGAEAENYEISYVPGTLKVSDADAVILTAVSCNRVYGEANPTFDFISSGADLVGMPEITCEATATSDVGTYPIVIKKGTVSNYNVTYVEGTLTITKAPLTVKADYQTRKQGEENPEFTVTYDGFKNEDNEAVLTTKPTVTCEATKESEPGDYAITVGGAKAKNYEITYESGTLTVVAADGVVVKAKSYTRYYGEANPVFEYETEGAELIGTPKITCAADAKSAVGTYDIIIEKGGVTNYNDKYVKGTLTIKKAPLTIKAGEYTRKQGEKNPEFTLTYEGFKNDENEDVLTKKPEATCEADEDSEAGEYKVTVSGAEAQNYEITYVDGTLTVTGKDPGPAVLKGDGNGDGTVNAADIVEVVNYIMGHPSAKFKVDAADANGDGVVNASDIVAIVNIIMGN